jgi:starvation-inducible DNA-binding protein
VGRKQTAAKTADHINAQPRFHQRAREIQPYGTVNHALPLELEEPVRLEMTEQLNQLLADTMTLLDLYKKSHWQVAGPTFYQLHLLFDKHYDEQVELVDSIAEGIQLLGASVWLWLQMWQRSHRSSVPLAVAKKFRSSCHDCSMLTKLSLAKFESWRAGHPPLGMTVRMTSLSAKCCAEMSFRLWLLSEHLVDVPLVRAIEPSATTDAA